MRKTSIKNIFHQNLEGNLIKMFRVIFIILSIIISDMAFAIQLITDSEVENGMRKLIDPIFISAGIDPKAIEIFIVSDDGVNAFVAGGRNIFINTGLVTLFNDPDVIKGVVAHELGHISGGHLARGSENTSNLLKASILTSLVGVAAMVAGAPEAGSAAIFGSGHFAQRGYLSNSRSHESAADQAAIKFLHDSGNTVAGLVKIQKHFLSRESDIADINPYAITHPLSKERLSIVDAYLKQENQNFSSTQEEKDLYARIVAKIQGFTSNPGKILMANQKKLDNFARRYEIAIAKYRLGKGDDAVADLNKLISEKPQDGYLYQTKGQLLFEQGKIKDAVYTYKIANSLLSKDSIVKVEYAIALLNMANLEESYVQKQKMLKESISLLKIVASGPLKSPYIYRQLATAYGKIGDLGNSNLMLAEEALIYHRIVDVRHFLSVAKKYVGNDKKLKLKLDDIEKNLRNIE